MATDSVHQLVHGYSGGHRQLAASIHLPSLADSVAVELSDLSGSAVVQSLMPYVTGYPLPDTTFYALAMTWAATEMPRPGSVWTHTLLIPETQVVQAWSFVSLLALFRKPTFDSSLAAYGQPLAWPVEDGEPDIGQHEMKQAIDVVSALYGRPSRPQVLTALSSDEYLRPILGAWRQQWPSLRLRFTFCTGAFAPRRLLDDPFMLQVAPPQSTYSWPEAHEMESPQVDAKPQAWLTEAARDLANLDSKVTKAARVATLPPKRELFKPLVELLLISNERTEDGMAKAAQLCVSYFPLSDQLPSQKHQLLSPPYADARLAVAATRALLDPTFASTVSSDDALLESVANDVAKHHRLAVIDLLNRVTKVTAPFTRDLIQAVASQLAVADVPRVAALPKAVAAQVIRSSPVFLTEAAWRQPTDTLMNLVNLLGTDFGRPDGLLAASVPSLLNHENWIVLQTVQSRAGDRLVLAVADWVKANQESVGIDDRAMDILSTMPVDVLERFGRRPANALAMADFLIRLGDVPIGFGPKIRVLEPAISALGGLPFDRRLQLAAQLFRLALTTLEPEAAKLAVAAFEPLHSAGMRDQLGWDVWSRLTSVVPSIGIFRDWDKCERLRRALLDSFRGQNWPLDDLLAAGWNKETVQAVRGTLDGRQYSDLRKRVQEYQRENRRDNTSAGNIAD